MYVRERMTAVPRELSESVQSSVLDALEEGVIVIDPVGRLLQANAAASAILGVDLASMPPDRQWWNAVVARNATDGSKLDVGAEVLLSGREVRGVAVEVERRDGTCVSLLMNYLPFHDGEAVGGLVLSFRDTTVLELERKRRIELRRRLSEALEVARLASWEWQPETDEVIVFQAIADGDAEADAVDVTRTPLDVLIAGLSASERIQVREDFAEFTHGNAEESVRRHLHVLARGPIWLEIRSRAVRDAAGRLLCVRGTAEDITGRELAREQMAGGRDLLQSTLDSLSAHIAVLDERGEIVMSNRAWLDFEEAAIGAGGMGAAFLADCYRGAGAELQAGAAAGLRAIAAGEETEFTMVYPAHGPSAERWFLMRAKRYEGPGEARVVVAHQDISRHHLADAQVLTQAALLDEADMSVVVCDADGSITEWNRGAERLFGWSAAEALGRSAAELVGPCGSAPPPIALDDGAGKSAASRVGEVTFARRDGTLFPAYVRDRDVTGRDGEPAGTISVAVDITDRVASERALQQAQHYSLAVAENMGEGLLTLDVDGRVTYVNRAGEALLGWPHGELDGHILHDALHRRRPDGSPLPAAECPMLRARSERLTVRIDDDVFIRRDGRALPVAYTAASFQAVDGVEGCVVVFGDISERKAKEDGLRRDVETLSWIGRIRDALEQERFTLYAQPILDLRTGAVVQQELLLRMLEPDGSVVAPGEYLHIAEEYGLIGDIDRWVIARAAELVAAGERVEINISACSVGDADILVHLEECLAATGADPSLLVVEMTETAIIADEAAARAFAERLGALGCKLALDDFGTGYGTFTYLKQLPLDYLKIDIEFVRDLATNSASRHVVQAVIALARGFKLHTVAEGVEDADTFEMLRALGVDFAQGYHIARPQPMLAASAQAVLSANGRAGAPPSALRSTNESTQ